jgi:microcin C transport system substrate-binding protein
VLLWNINYTRLLYWNKFGMPPTVLGKYGNENAALAYWWLDPDSQDDLANAMQTNRPLPKRPDDVKFDDQFKAK